MTLLVICIDSQISKKYFLVNIIIITIIITTRCCRNKKAQLNSESSAEKQIHPAPFSVRASVWKNILLIIDLLLLWDVGMSPE